MRTTVDVQPSRASRMPFRLVAAVAVLFLFAMGPVPTSYGQGYEAPPPIGSWRGQFPDNSNFDFYLQADGTCAYGATGYPPNVGAASWKATSQGGILNFMYYNAGFETHLYFSVIWLDRNTITFSDGQTYKIKMYRVRQ